MVETVQTVRNADAMVYGLSGGLPFPVQLEADVVEQPCLAEVGQLDRCGGKPFRQVQEVISVGSQ
jgi:hypothetical protein